MSDLTLFIYLNIAQIICQLFLLTGLWSNAVKLRSNQRRIAELERELYHQDDPRYPDEAKP